MKVSDVKVDIEPAEKILSQPDQDSPDSNDEVDAVVRSILGQQCRSGRCEL